MISLTLPRIAVARRRVLDGALSVALPTIIWIASLSFCASASAQQSTAPQAPSSNGPADEKAAVEPILESIQSRRAAVADSTTLSDEVKQQLQQQLDQAVELADQATKLQQRLASVRTAIESGPAEIAALKAQLEQPGIPTEINPPADAGLAELENFRLADQQRLTEVESKLEAWESQAKVRSERRPQMPVLIETAMKEVEEAEKALATAPQEDADALVTAVSRIEREALLALRKVELEMVRAEQSRYEALSELFPLQRDVLTRDRNALEARLQLWDAALTQARQREVQRQEEEAARKLEEANPELRQLAERNSELTRERTKLQESLKTWSSQLNEFGKTLGKVEDRYEQIVEQEKILGLTTPIGLELRSDRATLPNRRQYERRLRSTEEEIRDLLASRFRLDSERRQLADIDTATRQVSEELSESVQNDESLLEAIRGYLLQKREYLDGLLADHQTAIDTLGKIDFTCRSLITLISDYQEYIDQRVLWIRSSAPIGMSYPAESLDAIVELAGNFDHRDLFRFFPQDFLDSPTNYLLFLAVFLLLVLVASRYRPTLDKLHEHARGPLQSGMPQHLAGLFLTLVAAMPTAALVGFLGSRLARFDSPWAMAVGEGLWGSAFHLWALNGSLMMFGDRGFAARFLEWPASVLRKLRAGLVLYKYIGIPLVFIFVALRPLENPIYAASIGRLAFILECLLLLFILQRLLRPSGIIMGELVKANPKSRIFKLRLIWYPLALLIPIYLAALSVMGFQYTAEQLLTRFQSTLVLAVGLTIVSALAVRWITADRRRLAIRQAQLRRQAESAARQTGEGSKPLATPASNLDADVASVDLSQLNRQGVQFVSGVMLLLFIVGCWGIWAQVLPAFQVISNTELWSSETTATKLVSTEAGGTRPVEVTSLVPTTLGHLLAALLTLAVAAFAGRNLPSLIELFVLERLPIDKGSRDAVKLATGYAMVIGGLVIASNLIGLQWNKIQWLAAALTVGLGFGLQEIFANFVAGVIILFERPVRLGDIVTIDNVTGKVSRIQIRATTITDWDRKEYIVPNKEFVTGKLLNWTLTDQTNRVVIEVGVAYGTDVAVAMEILERVASDHPLVLSDPAPLISFDQFGDSTLNLTLRCYLPNLDHRLNVITELNQAIAKRFQAAGIEIAFPQRDLHVRSMPSELTALLSKVAGS
jgi:potassium-dependent mechanosensitive channel